MESTEINDTTTKKTLIFLNFNGKIPPDMLDNQVFLKLAKLDTKNPVVQVNDMIFKGSYTHSIGTNLFFNKDTDPDYSMEFPYKDSQMQRLKFFQSQTKVLDCRQFKLPSVVQPAVTTSNDKVTYNFNWDYKELLRRFEDGTLELQDMFDSKYKSSLPDVTPPPEPIESMEIADVAAPANDNPPPATDLITMEAPIDIDTPSELLADYHNLLNLAKTPVRRQEQIEEATCESRFKKQLEFNSIECKILQPPLFSYPGRNILNSPSPHVDLQRCLTLKLIPSMKSTLPENILKLDNFTLLDLEARYGVIEGLIGELRKIKGNKRDQFGRTPSETMEVLEKLLEGLGRRIIEIKQSS